MGATGWSYFVEWEQDAGAAMEKLQRQVFERGEYGEIRTWEETLQALEATGQDVSQLKKLMEQRRAMEKSRLGGRKPGTIEEAIEQAAEEGTHSILDISGGISKEPDFGTAFPAPEEWLMRAYGTLTPTRKHVEENGFEPAEDLERWSAVYFAVSEETGGPARWWFFEGCSGD